MLYFLPSPLQTIIYTPSNVDYAVSKHFLLVLMQAVNMNSPKGADLSASLLFFYWCHGYCKRIIPATVFNELIRVLSDATPNSYVSSHCCVELVKREVGFEPTT